MEVIYTKNAQEDRQFWAKNDTDMLKRIDKLIAAIKLNPFAGLGKPEPLKFEKTGYWSRRINHEHRLIYKVVNKTLYIAQCRYHY
jgi:toxin YoeB